MQKSFGVFFPPTFGVATGLLMWCSNTLNWSLE